MAAEIQSLNPNDLVLAATNDLEWGSRTQAIFSTSSLLAAAGAAIGHLAVASFVAFPIIAGAGAIVALLGKENLSRKQQALRSLLDKFQKEIDPELLERAERALQQVDPQGESKFVSKSVRGDKKATKKEN